MPDAGNFYCVFFRLDMDINMAEMDAFMVDRLFRFVYLGPLDKRLAVDKKSLIFLSLSALKKAISQNPVLFFDNLVNS